jgi:hypothetical protein
MSAASAVWRERLLARSNGTTITDRVGFALALTCDERGIVWLTTRQLRQRLVAIWPDLALKDVKRGHRASGISYGHLKRVLASHPDWTAIGQRRYRDKKLGPTIRLLTDAVRVEIGLPVSFAEAFQCATAMSHGEGAWLSQIPEVQCADNRTPKTKSQRIVPKKRVTPVLPAGLDITDDLEELPGWLPLHTLEWEV